MCVRVCVHVCKCVNGSGLHAYCPGEMHEDIRAYVLRVIDLLEETNTIAVDKSQQHPTE